MTASAYISGAEIDEVFDHFDTEGNGLLETLEAIRQVWHSDHTLDCNVRHTALKLIFPRFVSRQFTPLGVHPLPTSLRRHWQMSQRRMAR